MNIAAFKALVVKSVELVGKLPVSGLIKLGVLAGVTIFSAWLLIKHALDMRKAAHEDPATSRRYSPVDELLGKHNYTSDPYAFDDLDDITREICAEDDIFAGLRPKKGKKKKKRKFSAEQKRRAAEVRRDVSRTTRKGAKDFFDGFSKSWLKEVDQAAHELGLPVDLYACDDKITPEIREEFSMLF